MPKIGITTFQMKWPKSNMKKTLATTRPDLLEFWDYEKNTDLDPQEFSIHSSELAWWKCEHGHSYQMPIHCKTKNKNFSSSVCNGRIVIPGINDFTTLAPKEILEEWCYEFNDITPDQVFLRSNRKFWWKCKHGHYWFISCGARINKHSGCPYCSGREAIPGENDLYTLHPEVIDEWDYEKKPA